ncbi:MAG: hypothetical protein IJZ81_01955 [Clostridia bacterium]|nr:hypothetical protein [Clostridia bacterium]
MPKVVYREKIKTHYFNQKFITKGVSENIPIPLQMLMWEMIQDLPADKDYLQVLSLSEKDGKLAKENFEYSYYSGKNWWDFGFSSCGWGRSYSKIQSESHF